MPLLNSVIAADTLCLKNQDRVNLHSFISVYEDTSNLLEIEQVLDKESAILFERNSQPTLNFQYSTSSFWLSFVLCNTNTSYKDYYVIIKNPDIDIVDFYVVSNDSVIKTVKTGELRDISTRDEYHRYFTCKVGIEANGSKKLYIKVYHGGHPLFVPIEVASGSDFFKKDHLNDIFNWFVYGLLFFIYIFNFYYFKSTRDKVSLYYALYVLSACLYLFMFDGYAFHFNPPIFVEKIKWIFPALYVVFLVSFTQVFISNQTKFEKLDKYLNVLKILSILFVVAYSLPFPWSLFADIGLPILILVAQLVVITLASITFSRKYTPSVYFLVAYCVIFIGMLVTQLKELDILPSIFFTENSVKLALSVECLLLTFAILERFKEEQKKAQLTIQYNVERIESQNTELELINTELEKLSIVASETDNSVSICDISGTIEWCNTCFERFYDVSLEELIERNEDNIISVLGNKSVKNQLHRCVEEIKPIALESQIFTKRKKELWVVTTLSPYVRRGKVEKIIAIDADITKMKRFEKRLKDAVDKAVEADRLKTAFLGNMSHEIRTPLNGIVGFSELLKREGITEKKKGEYLAVIQSNSEQLMKIIDDIIDISMIESNQLRMDYIEVNLLTLVEDIYKYYRAEQTLLNKEHISFNLDNQIQNSKLMVKIDVSRVQQVFHNVLKNAFKFTEEGEVNLVIKQEEEKIQVEVHDTGCGVSDNSRDSIFERFRQGEETLERRHGGAGLGLSISKGILEKLGGNIWLAQSGDNGSVFCFNFLKETNPN